MSSFYPSSSSFAGVEVTYIYKHVPQNATSCLVNIVYGGTNSTPTSVLAASDGSFKVNKNGAFIPVESPLCTPYTGENVQTITVVPANTEIHISTKTIWESPWASSSRIAPEYYYSRPALSHGDIAGIIISAVTAAAILCGVGAWLWRRRRARRASPADTFSLKTFEDDSAFEGPRPVSNSQKYNSIAPQVTVESPSNQVFEKDAMSSHGDGIDTEMASTSGDARSSLTWIGSGNVSPRGKRDSMSRFDAAVSPI